MSKATQPTPQGAAILAAIGKRGTEATFTTTDFAALAARIGGTVRGYRLDQSTAVYYSAEAQTATLLDEYALEGVLVLCGVDRDGNPVSLSTLKQANKYGKVFKFRNAKTDAEKGGV